MVVLLCYGVALAQTLALSGDVWFAQDGAAVQRAGAELSLGAGYVFGVELDDTAAGFVFVGQGGMQWDFATQNQARRVVNVMQMGGELSASDAAVIFDHQGWSEVIDMALVLGDDAHTITDGLRSVTEQTGVVGYIGEDGQFEVVVTDYNLRSARRRAAESLSHRTKVLSQLGLDPAQAVRLDRLEDGDRWVIDAHHDRSWRPLLDGSYRAKRTQWTTWIEDGTGAVDQGHRAVVIATGLKDEGGDEVPVVRRLTAHDGLVGGVRIDRVLANVVATPTGSGKQVDLRVESLITVSTDRPSQVVALHMPCTEQRPFYVDPEGITHCEVTMIETANGEELAYIGPGFGSFTGFYAGGVYRLPKPLVAGETLKLRVNHEDRARLGHRLDMKEEAIRREVSAGGAPEFIEFGKASESLGVVAWRPGQTIPADSEVRLGVIPPYEGSVSGSKDEAVIKDGVEWSVAQGVELRVQVGRWEDESWYAAGAMPAVRTRTLDSPTPGVDVFVRASIHFFSTVLSPFPHREIELVEGPSFLAWPSPNESLPQPTATAIPGQIYIRNIISLADGGRMIQSRWPKAVELAVAQAVAAQWWLEPAYAEDDAWIGRVMPRVYRQLFMEEAYNKKVAAAWSRDAQALRNEWFRRPLLAPVSEATSHAELERAARLFTELVRARIGERAMLRGFDDFLGGEASTTRALQHALESAGGQSLDDVFEFWLSGGYVPEGNGSWSASEGELELELTLSVPHGRVMVPVQVQAGTHKTRHWVEVVDGTATFAKSFDSPVRDVQIDSEEWLPMPRWKLVADDGSTGR